MKIKNVIYANIAKITNKCKYNICISTVSYLEVSRGFMNIHCLNITNCTGKDENSLT